MNTLFIPNEGAPIDFNEIKLPRPDADGLVCVGANFYPNTLLSAYMNGLFPWYIHQGYPFWYSPDPRMVLYPSNLYVSKSMQQVFKKNAFRFSCDTAFAQVIEGCAVSIRNDGTSETWIDENFKTAYTNMHNLGVAHSFEAWHGNELVGGLYGLAIGEVFFGESMFTKVTNASKAAFIKAIGFLQSHNFKMIDCQVATPHLASLGAIEVARRKFLRDLSFDAIAPGINYKNWCESFDQFIRK